MPKEKEQEKYSFKEYSVADLGSAIVDIQAKGTTLRNKLQNVGLSIIRHWGKKAISSADAAKYFTQLAASSPYHGRAVATWVQLHTPCQWSKEAKAFYAHEEAKVNQETFMRAKAEPFWTVSPPPEPQRFDAFDMLDKLLTKNSKRGAEAKDGDHLIPVAMVNAIRKLMHEMKEE